MILVHTSAGEVQIVQASDDREEIYRAGTSTFVAAGPKIEIVFGRIVCLNENDDPVWEAELA